MDDPRSDQTSDDYDFATLRYNSADWGSFGFATASHEALAEQRGLDEGEHGPRGLLNTCMVNYDLGYLDQSLQFSQQHAPGPMLPFPQSYATTSQYQAVAPVNIPKVENPTFDDQLRLFPLLNEADHSCYKSTRCTDECLARQQHDPPTPQTMNAEEEGDLFGGPADEEHTPKEQIAISSLMDLTVKEQLKRFWNPEDDRWVEVVKQVFDAIMDWSYILEWKSALDRESKAKAIEKLSKSGEEEPCPGLEPRPSVRDLNKLLPSVQAQQQRILGQVPSDQTIELLAWGVVEAAVVSQQGVTQLPTCFVLRHSKQLVKSILTAGDGWKLRIVNAPRKEFRAKGNNRRVNAAKEKQRQGLSQLHNTEEKSSAGSRGKGETQGPVARERCCHMGSAEEGEDEPTADERSPSM
ncbi:hypothetical protein PLICBS_004758 [Purpureocillium lilacinum]|uniref:uncharacterized protein n=1 Tax=Purpureocillium lilacinum TaxID=33203 RepID=UPI002086FF09|nr:hypothetical protein PLICBS_004758 [Purpureocillium lilacinum]